MLEDINNASPVVQRIVGSPFANDTMASVLKHVSMDFAVLRAMTEASKLLGVKTKPEVVMFRVMTSLSRIADCARC
jgi:hypothetical protein